jgi:cathepsin L
MLSALLASVFCGLILPHEERSFVSFMRSNSLLYTGDEYHFRLGLYVAQARHVREFNSVEHTFKLGLNKFAVYTAAEYKVMLGSRGLGGGAFGIAPRFVKDPPDSYDWRSQNVVQVVKDQGQCGSCWTFGAVAAQESQWAIQNGVLTNLSEQNLVDCVTSCYGCDGGDKALAYDYVISRQSGHFNAETDYPYTARDGSCKYVSGSPLTTIVSYVKTKANDESGLLNGVYTYGPAGVSIDASWNSFQLYTTGVYNEPQCSNSSHDHVVLVTGWGADGSTPYWIVKNSWGADWGEKGYIRMSRNKNNQCCIACAVVIPQVK